MRRLNKQTGTASRERYKYSIPSHLTLPPQGNPCLEPSRVSTTSPDCSLLAHFSCQGVLLSGPTR